MRSRRSKYSFRRASLQTVIFLFFFVLPLVVIILRAATSGLAVLAEQRESTGARSSSSFLNYFLPLTPVNNFKEYTDLIPLNIQDTKGDASKLRTALVLTGAVGKVYYRPSSNIRQSKDLYSEKFPYTPIRITSTGIKKHIVEPNGEKFVDVFVHSWNPDLKDNFERYFNPVSAVFEDNTKYEEHFKNDFLGSDWRQVSWSYSIKKALESVFEYENKMGIQYDRIILYRPDLVLLKDINLDFIFKEPGAEATVFVNNHHGNGKGDFHFIMNHRNAEKFANLYDSLANDPIDRHATMHGWIKNYIENDMKASWGLSGIRPGKDEEVYRKLPFCKMKDACQELVELGFTIADFKTVRLNNCINITAA
mmetsp:Transcript_30282/g.37404  ORF Transcript_30282/g.37404 Transcript_30282/m.37404 type:complete len:365 (-) Transcript_30282:167-1261(-)|eukprot:CAMPEP_0204833594 /NCGR_PEP_ID=MMETSP1346-20131115/17144_1 /ASSEMBLY_ACC=CAM_ASM_000771 /TAXON_ID=215587 /ORGANISM="Aplanochytrium stocchinoi, Strain GSBS06" /LENGTH=364 /DNA_ID=CAMNT_0051966223 /DNA_START=265 /DNA_END=1359 /DNA_ORIENTATION=-